MKAVRIPRDVEGELIDLGGARGDARQEDKKANQSIHARFLFLSKHSLRLCNVVFHVIG